jgi:septal ring factor EnvC (AmiA/AmiB activator)
MKKLKKPFFTFLLPCILSSLFSPAVFSQDFSSIDSDLSALETLIQDTLSNSEEQMKQLKDLQQNLTESGALLRTYESIIQERENLLKDLQTRLSEMSAIYKTQSDLSAKYEKNSKFWRTFTLIALPSAALLSGGLVWAVTR